VYTVDVLFFFTTGYSLKCDNIFYFYFKFEIMATSTPSFPPCRLTQEKVLALRTDVPVVGGLCQNLYRAEGGFVPCGCPIGEHPSETVPAGQNRDMSVWLSFTFDSRC
jgi:hypothetical protein